MNTVLAAFTCLASIAATPDPLPYPRVIYDAPFLDTVGERALYMARYELIILRPEETQHVVTHEVWHHYQKFLYPDMSRTERERQAKTVQNCVYENGG